MSAALNSLHKHCAALMRWFYHPINTTHANITHSIAHTVAHLIHDRTRSVNAAPSSMRALGAFHGAEVRADPILLVSPNPGCYACCNAASLLFYHLLFSCAYIHVHTLTHITLMLYTRMD